MVCKNCKASIPDDSMFCPSCGQKVEAEPVVTPAPTFSSAFRQAGSLDGSDSGMGAPVVERKPVAPQEDTGLRFSSSFKRADSVPAVEPVAEPVAVPVNPKWEEVACSEPEATLTTNRCPHCGGTMDPDAKFCNNCGKKLSASLAERAAKKFTGIKAPKLPKKGIIAAASIALILAIVLIVGAATNWFGVTGPAAQIARAVKNTFAAKNFSVDFEYTYNEYREWGTEVSGTAYVALDPDKRELTLYADVTAEGESGVIAIYDGFYIVDGPAGCWGYDVSEELDAYFDAYEEGTAKDFSWEDFINSISYEGAYDEAKEDIDFDKLDTCLAAYIKKLNDKKWLEENAGYSVEKDGGVTMHCFNPDIYSFLKASASEIENAFIDQDLYDEMNDGITDLRSGSKYTDTNIVFGIKGGKLVHFEGKVSGSYDGLTQGDELHIEADFYDIGKTKIDTDELDDMLAEAKKNGY